MTALPARLIPVGKIGNVVFLAPRPCPHCGQEHDDTDCPDRDWLKRLHRERRRYLRDNVFRG